MIRSHTMKASCPYTCCNVSHYETYWLSLVCTGFVASVTQLNPEPSEIRAVVVYRVLVNWDPSAHCARLFMEDIFIITHSKAPFWCTTKTQMLGF